MKCPECRIKIPKELMKQKKKLSSFHCHSCNYHASTYKGMEKLEKHIKDKEDVNGG